MQVKDDKGNIVSWIKYAGGLASIAAVISFVVGTFFAIDSRYAHASNIKNEFISQEQAINELTIDMLEERMYRARRENEKEHADRIQRKIKRLEDRQKTLDKIYIEGK